MCTLIVAVGLWPDAPLVAAANRDEQLERPSQPPEPRINGGVRMFAPADRIAGGTWLGVNEHGVFVAITNRVTAAAKPGARSRGQLVLDALSNSTAREAAACVAEQSPARHNPFHLVMADVQSAHLLWSEGETFHRHRMQPGMHIVTERSLGAAPTARLDRVADMVRPLAAAPNPPLDALKDVLRVRAEPPLEGVNVRHGSYGTRSSSVVVLTAQLAQAQFWYADGRPDEVPFGDYSNAMRQSWRSPAG